MKNILIGKAQTGWRERSVRKLRWFPSALIILTVAGLCSLTAPAAKADTWNFSLTDPSNTNNINFSFDTAAPSTDQGQWFQMNSPVDWTANGADQGTAALAFFNTVQGGGLWLGDSGSILNLWGPQLYTGPESAPTFVEGTYSFLNTGGQFTGPLTLTVVDPPTPTPEPSSVLLLGAGLLGMLGFAGYQAKRARVATSELA